MAASALAGGSQALAAGAASTASSHRPAPGSSGGAGVGGSPVTHSTRAHPTVRGFVAKIVKGVAYAPSYAPIQVKRAIWAGNKIRRKPYIWGGGHATFADAGYDCSGAVSYVLHAAGLLKFPMDSTEFMSWGTHGRGHWITVYTNPSHAFIQIAGIRFDTSAEGDPHPPPGTGPRWRPVMRSAPGFSVRHPTRF